MYFVNPPRYVDPAVYQRAVARVIERLAAEPGLLAVYQMGGVGTPGISDLDVVAVFEDGATCTADPLAHLDGDERYLFTHSVFGVSRSFFAEVPCHTRYHRYAHRWGAVLPTGEAEAVAPDDPVTGQIVAEYLLMNYISKTIERQYGVVDLRGLFLTVHGLRYDLAFLDVREGRLYDAVEQLVTWREAWFDRPVAAAALSAWMEGFHEALGLFLAALLQRRPLYLPPWARLRYSRSVQLRPSDVLGIRRLGLLLPARWGRRAGKRFIKALHRVNRFEFAVPMTRDDEGLLAARFQFLKAMKAYNAAHLPAFGLLSGSGNVGENVV